MQRSLLLLLHTSDLPMIPNNAFVGYDEDSALLAEVPKTDNRMPAVLYLDRNLARICDWCNRRGMLVNSKESKTLIISTSSALAPIFPNMILEKELQFLGVVLDTSLSLYQVDSCFCVL